MDSISSRPFMKYACLVYHEVGKLESLSEAELDELGVDCMVWLEELKRSGRHVVSVGLQSLSTATTLRRQGGKLATTDGPFSETKEYLGGLTVIDARDLNEAIQVASTHPVTRFSTIEVRPTLDGDVASTDTLDQKIAASIERRGEAAKEHHRIQPR
jgi:hypothetical protein